MKFEDFRVMVAGMSYVYLTKGQRELMELQAELKNEIAITKRKIGVNETELLLNKLWEEAYQQVGSNVLYVINKLREQ